MASTPSAPNLFQHLRLRCEVAHNRSRIFLWQGRSGFTRCSPSAPMRHVRRAGSIRPKGRSALCWRDYAAMVWMREENYEDPLVHPWHTALMERCLGRLSRHRSNFPQRRTPLRLVDARSPALREFPARGWPCRRPPATLPRRRGRGPCAEVDLSIAGVERRPNDASAGGHLFLLRKPISSAPTGSGSLLIMVGSLCSSTWGRTTTGSMISCGAWT